MSINDYKQSHQLLTPVDLSKRQYATTLHINSNSSHRKSNYQTNEELLETRVRTIQDRLNQVSSASKASTPIRCQLIPKEINHRP